MPTLIPFIPYLKQDGTARVLIKITHNGERKYINTDIYVTDADLTKKHKVRSAQIQQVINRELDRLRTKLLLIRTDTMTVDAIKSYLTAVKDDYIDFVAYGRKCAQKRPKSASNYNAALNSLCKYLGDSKFDINNLTYTFITNYYEWVKGTRAPSLYTGAFRTILNEAKLEFNTDDIILVRVDPFLKFKIKQPVADQRALTIPEVQQLWSHSGKRKRERFAVDVWKLGFALIGMNEADLYDAVKIRGNVICYNRAKTKDRRKDNAYTEVRIEPEIMELFNKYRDPSGRRVFKFYKMYSDCSSFTSAVNIGLKYFSSYDFYSCRHSWATIARNDAGIDKYTVHEALNHVDDSMRVTDTYITRSFTHIWAANRKVLDAIR